MRLLRIQPRGAIERTGADTQDDMPEHGITDLDSFSPDLKTYLSSRPEPVRILHVDPSEHFLTTATFEDWDSFCTQLVDCLPDVEFVSLHNLACLEDRHWARFLHHLPTDIQTLHINGIAEDMPETFRQLRYLKGISMIYLEGRPPVQVPADNHEDEQTFWTTGQLSPKSCKILLESLAKLHDLESISLENLVFQNKEESVSQLLSYLSKDNNFTDIEFSSFWAPLHRNGQPSVLDDLLEVQKHMFDESDLHKLQYGPRLNRAKEMFLTGENTSEEDIVKAMISVCDRFDCFHYFMRKLNPMTIYDAVKGCQLLEEEDKNDKKRKSKNKNRKRKTKKWKGDSQE